MNDKQLEAACRELCRLLGEDPEEMIGQDIVNCSGPFTLGLPKIKRWKGYRRIILSQDFQFKVFKAIETAMESNPKQKGQG